ncbi:DUF1127 domain-containing protein [Microvirga brassicacearum]|uniref:DUF1127 domain-containing protein n=1 Tax=Microvirga brassicacearum TaxID=2580413 RepID=A0A5N3P4F9_9HYPH|nr:DUF1127 domain-containing protein [Microvirga brassicacearum]KAB0264531.1 DUF1127 domain-containing protein [Microvirga brassicacearum]
MTNLTHTLSPASRATSLTTLFQRAGGAFGAVVVGLATRWRHRREVRRLAEFDDRMLKDIGLTRSEVEGALAEPFFRDRAVFLVRWNEPRSPREPVKPMTRARPKVPLANSHECCA